MIIRMLIISIMCLQVLYSKACGETSVSNINQEFIGNGTYRITLDFCDRPTNTDGSGNDANVHGILLEIPGVNITGTGTTSFTSASTGLTINYNQVSPTMVEWGDWGNDLAPNFINHNEYSTKLALR